MKRILTILLETILFVTAMSAQKKEVLHFGENDGLSHRHVTQILQDHNGFIWLSTWNGIDRFDGRNFVTFKSRPGDGLNMPSDRIRKIAIDDKDNNILNCLVDKSWFRFSLFTGKFQAVDEKTAKILDKHAGYGFGHSVKDTSNVRFTFKDRQNLTWNLLDDGFDLIIPHVSPIDLFPWQEPSEVKAIFRDSKGRLWVTSKEDKAVRIYSEGTTPLYLSLNGNINNSHVSFSYSIYCINEINSEIWLGSKPDGLFILHDNGSSFSVKHISKGEEGLPAGNIYDIKGDNFGRVWLATMDAGLICLDHGHFKKISLGSEKRIRKLLIKGNVLLATTTEGLLVADINPKHKFSWHLHQRKADRESSLSNNACMDILDAGNGRYYVSTESGGINEITSKDLLAKELDFKHYDEQSGLGSDIVLSMSLYKHMNGSNEETDILAVTDNSIILLNTATGESHEYSQSFFTEPLSFSDARPLETKDGWLFGLHTGLMKVSKAMFSDDNTSFPIVLTSVSIENSPTDYTVNQLNEVRLSPDERTVSITFATLDYRNPHNIRYAYKIEGDRDWHYLGNDNNITLSKLSPGKYTLILRSTNAMGNWNPKTRKLEVIVEPKFTETVWFDLLLILFFGGLVFAFLWTRRYIRRIKQKQKETLEAYLTLLGKQTAARDQQREEKVEPPTPSSATQVEETQSEPVPQMSDEDKALMDRVMAFVTEHLADSDANVDDMASAAAVSRSGLNRKLKQIVGLTPADFLREARLKSAKEMLKNSSTPISDIAYRCGFSDPKYFSRVFRQSTNMTPTEFREQK